MLQEHNRKRDSTEAAAIAAVQASYSTRASAIIGLTTTGRTAHIASKYRAMCPFLAVTRHAPAARQMQLYRGVVPLFYPGTTLRYFYFCWKLKKKGVKVLNKISEPILSF